MLGFIVVFFVPNILPVAYALCLLNNLFPSQTGSDDYPKVRNDFQKHAHTFDLKKTNKKHLCTRKFVLLFVCPRIAVRDIHRPSVLKDFLLLHHQTS